MSKMLQNKLKKIEMVVCLPYPVGTILATKVNDRWQNDKIDHYIVDNNGLKVVLILNCDKQPRLSTPISIDRLNKNWYHL